VRRSSEVPPDSLPTSEVATTAEAHAVMGVAEPAVAAIEAVYYTDPLCPWSWALEPEWRRVRFAYGDRLRWRYVMGGMIADWRSYHDALNAVHNPGQMGLQCYQARQLTGVPLDERIWHDDPPESSYPACLAVKAAERQGARAGEAYLRRVREAVMLGRRNVAHGQVLMALARELADDPRDVVPFDLARFREDLLAPDITRDLENDLRQVAYQKISRFPTLVLCVEGKPRIALAGYRPYAVLRRALEQLAPEVTPHRDERDLVGYLSYWMRATGQEVAEALGVDRPAAQRWLDDAVAAGMLAREESLPDGYRIAGA
jgi:predicted DsbA family dithiol-disulfide isomerase